MIRRTMLMLLLLSPVQWLTAGDPQDLDNRVVELLVTFQETSPSLPWQKNPPGVRRGYGVRVNGSMILTTENLVRHARLVEMRRVRSGEKTPLTIKLTDCQVDLALLKLPAGSESDKTGDIEFAEKTERKDSLELIQFDDSSQLLRGKAQVLNISVTELPTAPYPSLTFTVLAEIAINGEGAPALRDGKLAGLVASYDPAARTGKLIPFPILKRFMQDAIGGAYAGFASAGVVWAPLIDPAKRAFLKAPADEKGILVTSCLPNAASAKVLKANDVIVSWDDVSIDSMGFYDDADFGRVGFSYLIKGRRKPGDTVKVGIIRDGAAMTTEVRLDRWIDSSALIPEDVTGERNDYLIEGGMVFREVTGRYLQSRGSDWRLDNNVRLVNMYLTQKYAPSNPGDHVVILAGVLPDPINIGYQQFHDHVVTGANGKPVNSINDLFKIVDTDGRLKRLQLKSVGAELVLDANELPEANDRIAENYVLPALRHRTSKSSGQ